MKIKDETQIDLTPKDVKNIIKEHFKKEYDITSIYFSVDGVADPSDWRAEYPMSYELTKVRCTANKK
jgi:hypothetical protein